MRPLADLDASCAVIPANVTGESVAKRRAFTRAWPASLSAGIARLSSVEKDYQAEQPHTARVYLPGGNDAVQVRSLTACDSFGCRGRLPAIAGGSAPCVPARCFQRAAHLATAQNSRLRLQLSIRPAARWQALGKLRNGLAVFPHPPTTLSALVPLIPCRNRADKHPIQIRQYLSDPDRPDVRDSLAAPLPALRTVGAP